MPRIQAVSFDGDDTLWHFETVLRAALEASLEALREALPGPASAACTIEDLHADRVAVEPEEDGAHDLHRLRALAFARTLERLGRPDMRLAEHLCDVFHEHRSSRIEPYPDVFPLLDALDGRYVVGLVSNGNADTERCVLAGRFAFRVHAHEHGVAKPDPRLFDVALRAAGCAPGEMLHVGDSLLADVAGARAAGVRSVWLNRLGERNETGIRPDAEIASLAELPALLERLA